MSLQTFSYEKTEKQREIIKSNMIDNPAFRVWYCEHDFYVFCVYYFSDTFNFNIQEFHKYWYKLASSNNNLLIVAFRSSGKTAIFWLFYIIYCICYKREEFILFLAFTQKDATLKITNIINALKTNKKLIQDFGYIYQDDSSLKRGKDKAIETKTQSKFITTNGILVQAISLDVWVRGLQFYNNEWEIIRPSFVLADDVDILKSVKNVDVIDKNEQFILSELFGWLEGRFIFLWNIVAEDGVVPRLINKYKESKKVITNKVALVEDWEITWKDKFVKTEEEAQQLNQARISNWQSGIVKSIEELKKDGVQAYNSNYLNIPYIVLWDPVFITENVERIQTKKPIKTIQFKVWSYNEDSKPRIVDLLIYKEITEQLCIWVDVWGGNWWDYTDITWVTRHNELVFRLRSNLIKTEQTSAIIKHLYYNYNIRPYKNALWIERNSLWIAVVNGLMDDTDIYRKIYLKRPKWKVNEKPSKDRGWHTNAETKEIMIWDLRALVDNNKLEIDETQKREIKTYIIDEDGSYNAQSGCYDDSVISRAISYQMTKSFKY